jgi:anthranilate synthase component I
MFNKTSLEQFLKLAQKEKRIAVFAEISGDAITPISAFACLGKDVVGGALLESGLPGGLNSNYSFICLQPYGELSSTNNKTYINKNKGVYYSEDPPLELLQQQLQENNCYSEHIGSQYVGGAVGLISYDAVRLFENIPDSHTQDSELPDLLFKFYKTCVAFDHKAGKVIISTIAEVKQDAKKAYLEAFKIIDDFKAKIFSRVVQPAGAKEIKACARNVQVDVDDDQFAVMVERAKEYIVKGDAFQIVLSRTFYKEYSVSPFAIYRALRLTNPSPYMFYYEHGDVFVLGSSPEKLVSVNDGEVAVNPIAGTRPRGKNNAEDKRLAEELLNDEKEVAEHVMLVDLARNDIGAVCEAGSVAVKKFKEVHKFSQVMHIASVVEGKLRQDKDMFNALRFVFPAGTLSGAPKIRAMEIIDELETSRRGFYGGAVCFIDNAGNFNSCIAIRMAVLKDGVAKVRAGAGIVFDSDPCKEAEETRCKASAVLNAIAMAEEIQSGF